MDIKHLLSGIVETSEVFDVSGLSLNSKTLTKGDLFIALQGEKSHGAEYIDSAIENGCVGVLIEGKDFDCDVPTIRIDNLKPKLSKLSHNFYTKAKDVNLIAVTGTIVGGFWVGRAAEGAREAIFGGFWAGRDAEGAREAIFGGFWPARVDAVELQRLTAKGQSGTYHIDQIVKFDNDHVPD